MKEKKPMGLSKHMWVMLCLLIIFCSCSTVIYVKEVNGKDVFVAHDNMITNEQTGEEVNIHHTYLQYDRYFIPWADLEMGVGISPHEEKEKLKVITLAFDIYTLNDKLIKPVEERRDLSKHNVYKRYRNSLFFPNKVKVKTQVKIFYNNRHYEYTYEAVISRRYKPFWAITA